MVFILGEMLLVPARHSAGLFRRTSSRDVRSSGMNLTGTRVTATFLDGAGEFIQERVGLRPVDASVGDALSIDKRLAVYEALRSGNEIALNHDTHDAALPVHDLF